MEKQELFRIGDMARLFHVSVGSLRHYEEMGLVQPEYVDPDSGYRYYSTRQFEPLNTIRYLRVLDMPLARIGGFLQNRNLDKIQEMLCQQRQTVMDKQRELKRIQRKIETRLRQLQDAAACTKDVVEVRELPPRRLAYLRADFSIDSYEAPELDLSILALSQGQEDPLVFLGKVGASISKENLLARQFGQYNIVFLLLEDEDQYGGSLEELPGETYATLRFCGSHKDAPAYYEKLVDYIQANGYQITGSSKELTLIDFGLTCDPGQFVTEIQIPIASAAGRSGDAAASMS